MTIEELEQELVADLHRDTETKIHDLKTWIAYLTEWREMLCAEIREMPAQDVRTLQDQAHFQELLRSISNIDRGCEYWHGTAVLGLPLAALIKAHYRPIWDGPRNPWAMGHGSLECAQQILESLQRQRARYSARDRRTSQVT